MYSKSLTARLGACAALFCSSLVGGVPAERAIAARATNRLVFAHFMIGITSDRTSPSAYDDDMQRAKAIGIDAFALNIGVDPYTDQQLGFAYQSAANNGMKVFISFDFNWWNTGQAVDVGNKIKQYASLPAQLIVDGKTFVSSFAGDGLDVTTLRNTAGTPLFFVPNWHPGQSSFAPLDGALNWLGWPNNGANKAATPSANVTVEAGDQSYIAALAGKPYLAPVSPWFSTHFGPEVSYSKNWVFESDLLWYNRWTEILTLGPRFIEIVTWNDYGESHYIGPLSSPHTDDGASKWVNDMPHGGWLEMAKPYIAAYKDGATSVNSYIKEDRLVYWYRQNPSSLNCDATDTTLAPANNASGNYFEGRPDGWQFMADSVFVVALLLSPGTVHINSGGNVQSFSAPAGATAFSVPMGVGKQSFGLERNGALVLGETSLKDITTTCPCGLYNFNAFVGTIPQGQPFPDQLQPDGRFSLTMGLHVSTCQATPTLGTSALPYPSGTLTGTTPPPTSTKPPTTSAPTSTALSSTITTPPVTTTPPPTTTTTTTSGTGCNTITASSQIFPTNCIHGCDVWAGPPGQAHPDHCDDGH